MKNLLIVFMGPSGVGKTHFTTYLATRHVDRFAIARSITTRAPRDAEDHSHYDFLADEAFVHGVRTGEIVQTAEFRGKRYGLSLPGVRTLLEKRNGLLPLLASALPFLEADPVLWKRTRIVALEPVAPAVLRENLLRRGTPPEEIDAELIRAEAWERPHRVAGLLYMRGVLNNLDALAQGLSRQLGI